MAFVDGLGAVRGDDVHERSGCSEQQLSQQGRCHQRAVVAVLSVDELVVSASLEVSDLPVENPVRLEHPAMLSGT
jgi:hypothetical protein